MSILSKGILMLNNYLYFINKLSGNIHSQRQYYETNCRLSLQDFKITVQAVFAADYNFLYYISFAKTNIRTGAVFYGRKSRSA